MEQRLEPTARALMTGVTAEAITSLYLARIRRFAVFASPEGVDPEDIAQQSMLRALERIDSFDPKRGQLESWLWRIVINVARDAGRVSRRRELLLERIASDWAERTSASAENLALDSIRDEKLVAAVRRLPKRYRSVIAMRFGLGLDGAETARLLGTTRMAIAKATRRALDRLRGDLENEVTM